MDRIDRFIGNLRPAGIRRFVRSKHMAKKIIIEPITRIEGHAKVTIDLNDNDEVIDGRLYVLEIRGFEKFVQHMELGKMPLITARICGVCPAAHHLAAAIAIENGCAITIPPEAQLLRELLYMGHILHSHALSCFVLLGPDVVGGVGAPPKERNIFHMLSTQPELAKKALRLRSIGQKIVEIVGGRGVHPVVAVPGGMASRPTPDEMKNMAQWGHEALGIVEEIRPKLIEMLAKLEPVRASSVIVPLPMALSKDGVVDFLQGECRALDEQGATQLSFTGAQYSDHLIENIMPGSYMKSVRLKGKPDRPYFVGPLARLMVNSSFSTPKASTLLNEFKKSVGTKPTIIDFIGARLIEMVHCAQRIIELSSQSAGTGALCVEVKPREGRFVGIIEAPRGILIHDYSADSEGQVTSANLIVATQNNYDAINSAIIAVARHFQPAHDENLFMNGIEFAVRCFDPCLSCATHVAGRMPMKIEFQRNGKTIRTISKE
jgi:F420-non-reducing hydrogenase large subunit